MPDTPSKQTTRTVYGLSRSLHWLVLECQVPRAAPDSLVLGDPVHRAGSRPFHLSSCPAPHWEMGPAGQDEVERFIPLVAQG